MYSITVDRTGFPLVHVEKLGVDVHLLPVTKVQFEAFLAEPNVFGDSWYEDVLRVNSRCSWYDLSDRWRERLFLTGVLPGEAEAFAAWLGSGFQLPSVIQWQTVCSEWLRLRPECASLETMLTRTGEEASRVVKALMNGRSVASLADLALMRGGVLEWVRGDRKWLLLGEPREVFCTQLFDWRTPITPTNLSRRSGECGFRLVKMRSPDSVTSNH